MKDQRMKKKGEQEAMIVSWILDVTNFLLSLLIVLVFVFLLFFAIIALCVVIVIRDNRREREVDKTRTQTQKQAEEVPLQDKKKIKQFQNLMNYDGTKQRIAEDED